MDIKKLFMEPNPPTKQGWYRLTPGVRNWTLYALVDRLAVAVQRIQEQPYTALQLAFDGGGVGEDTYLGNGFSKVCYPDVYNAKVGLRIARTRAIRKIVKALRESGNDYNVLVAKWNHYLNEVEDIQLSVAMGNAEIGVDPSEEDGDGVATMLVLTR